MSIKSIGASNQKTFAPINSNPVAPIKQLISRPQIALPRHPAQAISKSFVPHHPQQPAYRK